MNQIKQRFQSFFQRGTSARAGEGTGADGKAPPAASASMLQVEARRSTFLPQFTGAQALFPGEAVQINVKGVSVQAVFHGEASDPSQGLFRVAPNDSQVEQAAKVLNRAACSVQLRPLAEPADKKGAAASSHDVGDVSSFVYSIPYDKVERTASAPVWRSIADKVARAPSRASQRQIDTLPDGGVFVSKGMPCVKLPAAMQLPGQKRGTQLVLREALDAVDFDDEGTRSVVVGNRTFHIVEFKGSAKVSCPSDMPKAFEKVFAGWSARKFDDLAACLGGDSHVAYAARIVSDPDAVVSVPAADSAEFDAGKIVLIEGATTYCLGTAMIDGVPSAALFRPQQGDDPGVALAATPDSDESAAASGGPMTRGEVEATIFVKLATQISQSMSLKHGFQWWQATCEDGRVSRLDKSVLRAYQAAERSGVIAAESLLGVDEFPASREGTARMGVVYVVRLVDLCAKPAEAVPTPPRQHRRDAFFGHLPAGEASSASGPSGAADAPDDAQDRKFGPGSRARMRAEGIGDTPGTSDTRPRKVLRPSPAQRRAEGAAATPERSERIERKDGPGRIHMASGALSQGNLSASKAALLHAPARSPRDMSARWTPVTAGQDWVSWAVRDSLIKWKDDAGAVHEGVFIGGGKDTVNIIPRSGGDAAVDSKGTASDADSVKVETARVTEIFTDVLASAAPLSKDTGSARPSVAPTDSAQRMLWLRSVARQTSVNGLGATVQPAGGTTVFAGTLVKLVASTPENPVTSAVIKVKKLPHVTAEATFRNSAGVEKTYVGTENTRGRDTFVEFTLPLDCFKSLATQR